jgi:hypothetical protein
VTDTIASSGGAGVLAGLADSFEHRASLEGEFARLERQACDAPIVFAFGDGAGALRVALDALDNLDHERREYRALVSHLAQRAALQDRFSALRATSEENW